MRGLYWEEWQIGQEFISPARTITEADIVMFAGLSGDYNPLHTNEEYCKQTQFGGRIAHGPLVYAIAAPCPASRWPRGLARSDLKPGNVKRIKARRAA